MTKEYTPTEADLRSDWVWAQTQFGHNNTNIHGSMFDRAIAKIKADAWQEGYDEFERAHNMSNYEPWEYVGDNPYAVQA